MNEELDKVARCRKAANIRIVIPDGVHNLTLPNLPASVQLSPGRLTIQFDGVEQLLTHICELSQAAINYFERFRSAAEAVTSR